MSSFRLSRVIAAIVLAGSFLVSSPGRNPASGMDGVLERSDSTAIAVDKPVRTALSGPIMLEGGPDPDPVPYPEAVEVKYEDRQEEIQAMLSSYTDGASEIRATTDYTVTLGAWRNLRPTESVLWDISMLSPDYDVDCASRDQKSKGWIVGDSGTILSYCNGIWDHAISTESIPTRLWGVQAISPTLGVAVGEQGAVLMYLWDRIADDWVWTKSPIPVGDQTLYNVGLVPDGTGKYTGWAVGAANQSGRGSLVKGTVTPIIINGQANPFLYLG